MRYKLKLIKVLRLGSNELNPHSKTVNIRGAGSNGLIKFLLVT